MNPKNGPIWTYYGPYELRVDCIDTISKSVDILSIWSPYCPYHVPKSRYIFENIDFQMSIQRPCCPYMVHIWEKKYFFSSLSVFFFFYFCFHIEFCLGRCTKLTYFLHFYSWIFTFPICLFLPLFLYPIFNYNNWKYYGRTFFNFKMFLQLFWKIEENYKYVDTA